MCGVVSSATVVLAQCMPECEVMNPSSLGLPGLVLRIAGMFEFRASEISVRSGFCELEGVPLWAFGH